jgi:hypothetical protein
MAEPAAPAGGGKGTVKIAGQHLSKKTLMIAGLVGAGVIGYAYYRKSKSSGSAASTTTAGTDPATGYPYGSPEDTAALAAQTAGTNTNLSGAGAYGAIDPNTGIPYAQEVASGGGAGGSSTTAAASVTNSQWEQEAISDLEAGGVAQNVVSDAEAGLPRYLAKLSLTSGQATAVQMAVGLAGPPPEGGPFNIIPAAPTPITAPKKPGPKPKPKPSKTVTADGRQTLDEIARGNGISEDDLLSLNPGNESIIRKFWGTGKPVPRGSHWKV